MNEEKSSAAQTDEDFLKVLSNRNKAMSQQCWTFRKSLFLKEQTNQGYNEPENFNYRREVLSIFLVHFF